jgi:hypothetical protein
MNTDHADYTAQTRELFNLLADIEANEAVAAQVAGDREAFALLSEEEEAAQLERYRDCGHLLDFARTYAAPTAPIYAEAEVLAFLSATEEAEQEEEILRRTYEN